MKKSKKILSLLLALLMCVALLAACKPTGDGGGGGGGGDDDGTGGGGGGTTQKTLTIWVTHPFDANYRETLIANSENKPALMTKLIIDEFKKSYPDVTVRMTAKGWGDSMTQQIMNASVTNSLPDILSAEAYVRGFAELGVLQPIDLNKSLLSRIRKTVLPECTYNDQLYGVPLFTGNFSLVVNERLLTEKGIVNETGGALIPSTWEEWLDASQKLKATDASGAIGGTVFDLEPGSGNAFRTLAYMRLAGGEFVDREGNLLLNSPENVKAFTFMRDLMKQAPNNATGLTSYGDYVAAFSGNKAAYVIEHTDLVVDQAYVGNYNAYALPVPEAGGVYDTGKAAQSNVAVGQLTLCITKDCKDPALATAFLETCLGEAAQKAFFTANGRFPVIESVLQELETSTDPEIAAVVAYVRPYLQSLLYDDYAGGLPTFTSNFSQIWAAWDLMISDVVKTDKPIDQIVATAHNTIQGLMNA